MDTDAIAVLEQDHSQLQELFWRVGRPDENRPEVLKTLLRTLSAHVAAEKQLVAPMLRDHGDEGKALAEELGDDHDKIEKLIVRVERRKVNSPDLPDMVNELLHLTDRHCAHASARLFGSLRDWYSQEELTELGERLQSDELQLSSHPHPHLPDSGPLATVVRKVAGLIDRGRDSTTDLNRSAS